MKLTSQITVLAARRYNMTDDKTGELVQGIKLTYVESWDGSVSQNSSGLELLSATMGYDEWNAFMQLPAMFDAEFVLTAGSRGRPTLKITSLQYVQPFKPFSGKV